MATPHDTLHAIVTHPDDNAPRLAYADSLAAHGDPQRGDFIRTQIALAGLPADDDRRSELQAHERRRLCANAARWCDNWMLAHRFRRGFLEAIYCFGAPDFVERADAVFAANPVHEVWFDGPADGWDAHDTAALAASAHLSRIRALRLSPGCESGVPRDALFTLLNSDQMTALDSLELGHGMGTRHEIDDQTFCDLIGASGGPLPPSFRSLRRLGLHDVPIGDASVSAILNSSLADTLTGLDLSSNEQVSHTGILALVSSPLWPRLTELDVSGVHPHTLSRALIIEALQRSQIRRLAMHADPESLCRASSWGPLEALRLHCRSLLRDDQLRALLACEHLERLTRLDIRRGLSAAGAALLAHCPRLSRLTALNLAENTGLGDAGVMALAASPFLTRLTYVNLSQTSVGDAGLTALVRSPVASRLRSLNVSMKETGNSVGDAGLRALAASQNLGQLTTLVLDGTAITAAGLRALAESPGLPNLTYLGLSHHHFPDDGWQFLVEGSRIAWPGLSWSVLRSDSLRAAYKQRFGWFDAKEKLDWREPFFA